MKAKQKTKPNKTKTKSERLNKIETKSERLNTLSWLQLDGFVVANGYGCHLKYMIFTDQAT